MQTKAPMTHPQKNPQKVSTDFQFKLDQGTHNPPKKSQKPQKHFC